MGLNYSYRLYVHPRQLVPMLDWIRSRNRMDLMIVNDHNDSDQAEPLSDKQIAEELGAIQKDQYGNNIEIELGGRLSLLFDRDDDLVQYALDGWGQEIIDWPIGIGVIRLSISLNDDAGRTSPYLCFVFTACTSDMSRLFAASDSIRSAFVALARQTDAHCCLLDQECPEVILILDGVEMQEELDSDLTLASIRRDVGEIQARRWFGAQEQNRTATQLFREASGHENEFIRAEAIKRLYTHSEDIFKVLSDAWRDPSLYIRMAALPHLAQSDDPRAAPLVMEAMTDQSIDVRIVACSVAPNCANIDAVPLLISALRDECADVRISAATSLGSLGDLRAEEGLIELLADRNFANQLAVVLALHELRSPKSVWPLSQLLYDLMDGSIVYYAAQALGDIGDPAAVPGLIYLLKSQWPRARVDAIQAMAKIGDPTAIEPIRAMMEDNTELVRTVAKQALAQLVA